MPFVSRALALRITWAITLACMCSLFARTSIAASSAISGAAGSATYWMMCTTKPCARGDTDLRIDRKGKRRVGIGNRLSGALTRLAAAQGTESSPQLHFTGSLGVASHVTLIALSPPADGDHSRHWTRRALGRSTPPGPPTPESRQPRRRSRGRDARSSRAQRSTRCSSRPISVEIIYVATVAPRREDTSKARGAPAGEGGVESRHHGAVGARARVGGEYRPNPAASDFDVELAIRKITQKYAPGHAAAAPCGSGRSQQMLLQRASSGRDFCTLTLCRPAFLDSYKI